MTVTIRPTEDLRITSIEIIWSFDALFQEECLEHPDHPSWEIWSGSAWLILPDANGNRGETIVAPEEMIAAAKQYLARVCIATRSPFFWAELSRSDLRDLQASITVHVAGLTVPMSPGAFYATVAVRPAQVSVERAHRIAMEAFPAYASFLLAADSRFLANDYATAIVHLAQAIEVAAYQFLRTNVPNKSTYEFRLHDFFSSRAQLNELKPLKPQPFGDDPYRSLCELFGARNEWIHEGRRQVRLYDERTHKVPRGRDCKTRNLTREDFYKFRSAASQALEWLGEPGIE